MQLKVPEKLTHDLILKYQELYKMQLGDEITYEEACRQSMVVVELFIALIGIEISSIPSNEELEVIEY